MQLSWSLVAKVMVWIAIIVIAGALVLIEVRTHSTAIDFLVSALAGLLLACMVKLVRPHRGRAFIQRSASQLTVSTAGTSNQEKSIGQTLTTVVTPVLAVTGLLIYAVFSQAYDRLYGALGVDPGDVGLGYANTIASATGTVIWIIIISAPFAFTYFLVTFTFWIREITDSERSQQFQPVVRHIAKETSGAAIISFLCVFTYVFLVLPNLAATAAVAVQDGFPVTPVQLGPLVVFSPHADRARVEAVNTSQKTANKKPRPCSGGIDELSNRSVLFLGQISSTAVFYDAACSRAVYVPITSVVISIYP